MTKYTVKCPHCGGSAMYRTFSVEGTSTVEFKEITKQNGVFHIEEDPDSDSELDWSSATTTGYICAKCGLRFTPEQFKATALVEVAEDNASAGSTTSQSDPEEQYGVVGCYDMDLDVTADWAVINITTGKQVCLVHRYNRETHEFDDAAYGRALKIATELNARDRKESGKEEA